MEAQVLLQQEAELSDLSTRARIIRLSQETAIRSSSDNPMMQVFRQKTTCLASVFRDR